MQWRQQAVLLTAWQVQGFMDAFVAELGAYHRGAVRRELDAAVVALMAAGATQEAEKTISTSLTIVKNERRRDLVEHHLMQIVAIARKRAKTGESLTPEIQGYRMPKRRTPDGMLASNARGFASGAAVYEGVYAAQQMPRDFVKQAHQAADALQAAINDRSSSFLRRVAATRDAKHHTMMIRSLINTLDGLVSSELHRKQLFALLAAWKETKRYPQKPGVKRKRKKSEGEAKP